MRSIRPRPLGERETSASLVLVLALLLAAETEENHNDGQGPDHGQHGFGLIEQRHAAYLLPDGSQQLLGWRLFEVVTSRRRSVVGCKWCSSQRRGVLSKRRCAKIQPAGRNRHPRIDFIRQT